MISDGYESHCKNHEEYDKYYVQNLDLETCYNMAKYGNDYRSKQSEEALLYVEELARRGEIEMILDIISDYERAIIKMKEYCIQYIKSSSEDNTIIKK